MNEIMELHTKLRYKFDSCNMSIDGCADLVNHDFGKHPLPIFINCDVKALVLQQKPSLLKLALLSLSTSRSRTMLQIFASSPVYSFVTDTQPSEPSVLHLFPSASFTYIYTHDAPSSRPSHITHTHERLMLPSFPSLLQRQFRAVVLVMVCHGVIAFLDRH